jgi:hypothetical protein
VARGVGTPCTSSTAAIAAPRVIEPSVVMSGNLKTRKLMNTPNANSERMRPTVQAPTRSVISDTGRGNRAERADPAGTADEGALAAADDLAIVVQRHNHLRVTKRTNRRTP